MHSKNIAPQLRSNLDTKSEEYQKNKQSMLEKLDFIDDLLDQAELGGGAYHHERLAKRGKMPIRERIMNVIDDDSPFLEISPFAAYGTNYTVGGGCVSGIGMVAGVECVIFGNDPSILVFITFTVASLKSIEKSIPSILVTEVLDMYEMGTS